MSRLTGPLCPRCGLPLNRPGDECAPCQQRDFAFDAARGWGQYRAELRAAILQLKHRRNAGLGQALAAPLISLLRDLAWRVDLIVPIPLATVRQRTRGYNQIDLLAMPLAKAIGLPVAHALSRTRETAPQMDLQLRDRWANMASAFNADPARVAGKRVLVIDDIMTTGATMHAAAVALKTAGASYVCCLSLSRALIADEAARLVR